MVEKIPEAEAYIRFRLDELASRNEHHQFEEIATRVAQKRISSNILIATGPVSSGGDQQRDAETFITRLPNELPHSAGFAATASIPPVVVACTVQKTKLKQKVLSDLAGICAPDAADVSHVAFFSVSPIPEGVTHDLQRTALETYNVTLNIFCGGDIATFLAEPDLVWVARYYLELPSHMVPVSEDESAPQWYVELIDRLRRNGGPESLTPAVQGEIIRGLRHATWDRRANADLPEWLDFMGVFLPDLSDSLHTDLEFWACYEMAIARFRGMGVATGIEDLIRSAIGYACTSNRPNIIDDAVTLCHYWGTMWLSGVARADASEITNEMLNLQSHLVDMLDAIDSTTHPVRTATLTGTLAFAYLAPDWGSIEKADGKPSPAAYDSNVGVRLDQSAVDISAMPISRLFDFDMAMTYLEQLVELLPRARAYSPSELARVISMFAPVASEHNNYEKIRDGFDSALAQIQGDSAIAEQCCNRAVAFMRNDDPLKALTELHNVKVRWFNGDTLSGTILAMRILGSIYANLGLMYAAKMYACTSASLALTSDDIDIQEHVPKALLETAHYAHQAGTWIDAAGLTEVALLARFQMLTNPFDYNEDSDFAVHNRNMALELAGIRMFWIELEALIKAAYKSTGWYQQLIEIIDHADSQFVVNNDDFQEYATKQLAGPLFGDLGNMRLIDFQALGIRWIFQFANSRETVLTAEGLVAALQVILADIASDKPALIKSTIRVVIEVRAEVGRECDSINIDESGSEIQAHIILSNSLVDPEAHTAAILAMCFQLLQAVHVRPPSELQILIESRFRGGLMQKIYMGSLYEETTALLEVDHYARCAGASRPSLSGIFQPTECEHIQASNAIGPGYSSDESLQAIQERYKVAENALRFTLPRLLSDHAGRATIVRLRNDGWLDWQILVALLNVSMNWRMKQAGFSPGTGDPQRAFELAREAETSESPIMPLSEFSDSVVDMHIFMQVFAIARRWDLRVLTEASGGSAMRDFLIRRYRYAADDVPHRDLLDCVDGEGNLLSFLDNPADYSDSSHGIDDVGGVV